MTDEFDILSLLMPDAASEKAIVESDPYLAIKEAPDLVSQVLLKESANPKHSTKDKIIAGLLTGLTGGALGGLSSDYQTRAKNAYQDALFGKGQADVLDDDIFAMANQKRRQASIFHKLLGAQQADELDQFKDQKQFEFDLRQRERDAAALADKQKFLFEQSITADDPRVKAEALRQLKGLRGEPIATQLSPEPKLPEIDPSAQTDGTVAADLPSETLGPELTSKVIQVADATGLSFQKAQEVVAANEKLIREPWFQKMPQVLQQKAISGDALTQKLYRLSEEFAALNQGALDFQKDLYISGTPAYTLWSKLAQDVGNIVKLGGDTGTIAEQEQQRQLKATLGNITSNPKEVAERIKNLALGHRKRIAEEVAAGKVAYSGLGGGDALIAKLNQDIVPTINDSADGIQTRKLKDGRTVRVKPLGNGKWEMVP